MIEKIVSRRNMNRAIKQVVPNQGSAGVDGMSVKALPMHLKANWNDIATAICKGGYLPQAGAQVCAHV